MQIAPLTNNKFYTINLNMKKLTNEQLLQFTNKKKNLTEWTEFKQKWNNNIPKKGTALFTEYVEDSLLLTNKLDEIVKDIR